MIIINGFLTGVLGGVLMALVLVVGWVFGADIDLASLLGQLVMGETDSAWWAGSAAFLGLSGLFGLPYAWVFERLGASGWIRGLAIGIVHAVIAGVFLNFAEGSHDLMPSNVGPWHLLGGEAGRANAVTFLLCHALYGLGVGAIYPSPQKRR